MCGRKNILNTKFATINIKIFVIVGKTVLNLKLSDFEVKVLDVP